MIGDWAWYDQNGNGIQDPGEAGLAGVQVTLYRADGLPIATTQTDANGFYRFDGLPPGDYYLHFSPPTGYAITQPNQGNPATADAQDSDADPSSGQTAIVSLASGTTDLTQDVGLFIPANLSGLAWFDANQNGIRDPDENGIPAVSVQLYSADGALVATTTTDANGQYTFVNLLPGGYYVFFTAPPGYQSTDENQGDDDTVDSDALSNQDGLTAQTQLLTLQLGDNIASVDYGLEVREPMFQGAILGDRVWLDADRNGIQDATEVGVAGVVVNLFNAASQILTTTVTDSNGNYWFANLPPGVYVIEFILPVGYEFSLPGTDVGRDNDSNADPNTGQTGLITLEPGVQDLRWDAGIHQKPTALADGDEPDRPVNALYLPLVARKGIKIKLSDGTSKLIFVPCQQQRCIMP